MEQQQPSSWVPDKLPEFKSRPKRVIVNDSMLTKEFLNAASSLKIKPDDLYEKIVTFGLIIAMAENDPNSTVVERDQMGRERKVDLMTETYSVEIKPVDNAMPNKRLALSIPREISDDLMDIANKHHTTIEIVLKQMFILGVKAVNSQRSQKSHYVIRDQKGNNRQITI